MLSIAEFQHLIHSYYRDNRRSFPWRETDDPYKIMVSEIMLQQTQTHRVVDKYLAFLQAFPTVKDLAEAPTSEVLRLWKGLGYNRRALNLQRAAKVIAEEYKGKVPDRLDQLKALPGIGDYTAAAIAAFAFNRPVPLIETNVRRIYIHHFFPEAEMVSDKELMPLIEETLDYEHPRDWYYALMDYGSQLPKTVINPNRRSKHYTRQSSFEGSNRQLRGNILGVLLEKGRAKKEELQAALSADTERLDSCLADLAKEGFVQEEASEYRLT